MASSFMLAMGVRTSSFPADGYTYLLDELDLLSQFISEKVRSVSRLRPSSSY